MVGKKIWGAVLALVGAAILIVTLHGVLRGGHGGEMGAMMWPIVLVVGLGLAGGGVALVVVGLKLLRAKT